MDKNLNVLASLNTQLEVVTQTLNRQQADKTYSESILGQQLANWQAATRQNSPRPQTVDQELAQKENQLLTLQSRYTDDHPDIIKLKVEIEKLKERPRDTTADREKLEEMMQKPSASEPPQIQQLRGQIHTYQQAIQDATREQKRLQAQIQTYQERLNLSPVIEQEYKQLTRDYQTALDFYNDLLRKKNQSEMTTDLERLQQGEQFRVLDSASYPEKPTTPDRPMLALEGLAGGAAIGRAAGSGTGDDGQGATHRARHRILSGSSNPRPGAGNRGREEPETVPRRVKGGTGCPWCRLVRELGNMFEQFFGLREDPFSVNP